MTSTPERVLITGGAHGIGAAIVDRCQQDGYQTVVLDREGDDVIHCDLADPVSTSRALMEALDSGPISRLVNNVGAVFPNTVSNQTLGEFDAALALNLRSALQCTQAVLPAMRESGFGRIVSMSSRAALGKRHRSAYAASKAGLIGMTRVWAQEEGGQGITANTVGPGPIATGLFEMANPEESTHSLVDAIPVGRLGTPDDVAHTVSFLLDSRSGFITGQTLYVCGGLTLGRAHV